MAWTAHISLDYQKNLTSTWEFLICEFSGSLRKRAPNWAQSLHLHSIPHYLRSHFQRGAKFPKIYFMSHVSQTRSKQAECNCCSTECSIVFSRPSDEQWCFQSLRSVEAARQVGDFLKWSTLVFCPHLPPNLGGSPMGGVKNALLVDCSCKRILRKNKS